MYTSWTCLTVAVYLSTLIHAHTAFTTLFVNGVSQGDGTCVRMNTTPGRVNFPIADITSDDITCGQAGIQPVARTCPIQAGDTVSFQFRSGPGSGSTESIVEGHRGPCAIYMKQMSTSKPLADGMFPSQSPAGDGWFKIMYNATDGQDKLCTERVNHTTEGVITTKIPTDVAPGYYLLRPELLALHAATKGDPQFYTGCAQVYIFGGTGKAHPETAAIPGYVKYSDRAMSWNLYNQTGADYPEYGPKLYKSGADNSTPSQASIAPSARPTASTAGGAAAQASHSPSRSSCKSNRANRKRGDVTNDDLLRQRAAITSTHSGNFSCPSDTILELGNLCLPEVPHWLDSPGSYGMPNCWASQQYCWDIATMCWKERCPAVSYQKGQGCNLYAQRCTTVGNDCKNSVMEGPPDEGKVITPKKVKLSGLGVQG